MFLGVYSETTEAFSQSRIYSHEPVRMSDMIRKKIVTEITKKNKHPRFEESHLLSQRKGSAEDLILSSDKGLIGYDPNT